MTIPDDKAKEMAAKILAICTKMASGIDTNDDILELSAIANVLDQGVPPGSE